MPTAPPPSCVTLLQPHARTEPSRTVNHDLLALARSPWLLRVGRATLLVRPTSPRDLPAVGRLHTRCSPRTLLDRYRCGGRAPAVATLDLTLRAPLGVAAVNTSGEVVALGSLARDPAHGHLCAEVGLLVRDDWQRLGIGSELTTHLAGAAQAAGFHELIAYPATAVGAAHRLLVDVGRTRRVAGAEAHLHTYLPESATLGLGPVRERLAG